MPSWIRSCGKTQRSNRCKSPCKERLYARPGSEEQPVLKGWRHGWIGSGNENEIPSSKLKLMLVLCELKVVIR